MNQDRLHAVWKVTSEAIDELHRSLESSPGETAVAEDPAGLKVSCSESCDSVPVPMERVAAARRPSTVPF